jgi:hypothetical protein
MSQFCVPAVPGGQSTMQAEPASHVVWHGPLWQRKWQALFGPQVHWPSAHTPSQLGFEPVHATWHGGELQANEHEAPSSHVQVPFAHVAVHADWVPHSTWQGGAAHPSWQLLPEGQTHVPFEQSLETLELHAAIAAIAASTPNRSPKGLEETRLPAMRPLYYPPNPASMPNPAPPRPRHTAKPSPRGTQRSPAGHSASVAQS